MAAQVQIQSIDAAGQNIYVVFKVVLSGSYPTGGEPLNFTGSGTLPVIQDPTFIGLVAAIESSSLLQISVESQGGNLSFQYAAIITAAGTPATINPQTGVKLKISVDGTFGTEHSAAAYSGDTHRADQDTITGFAVFNKLL
jgi:hypothetical protein